MQIQEQILKFFEQIRTEPLTLLMTTITMMAETLFIVAIIALLYWCVDKAKSRRLGFIVLCSAGINGIVKNIIKMPRPFQVGVVSPIRVQTATSYSFPSGHTQSATSFWGGSMLILKQKSVLWVGSLLILLTGLSRLYLGVHWPMDVVGGILFGITCVLIAGKLLDEKAIFNNWHIIGASVLVLGVLIFEVDADLYKSIACLWALVVGCVLEEKYIKFEPRQAKKVQLLKIVVGIAGLAIIYGGLKAIFPDHKVLHMVRYALVVLWVACGAPLVFTKLQTKIK